ncbi:MAG: LysR family transcriptional regulator [Rhodobacterales bacterium]
MARWNGYLDFLTIAEAGSISAAARRLGQTQPTLSRRLSHLEAEMGVKLMSRTPTGLSLTPAGEQMLATLEKVRDRLSQMERQLHHSDVALRGAVRITVTETLGIQWLAPLMREFYEAYPNIRVEMVIDNAMVNLLSREAHIAIRLLRPVQPDLIAKQVGYLDISLFASRTYADRYGLPHEPLEATQHRAVGLLGITPTAVLTEKLFSLERHVFLSNSLLAVQQAIGAGLGIGPVVRMIAEADNELVPCLPDNFLHKEIWLTAVPEIKENARFRVLFDFLSERLG